MNPKIYSSLIVVTKNDIPINGIQDKLNYNEELKDYFFEIYKLAYRFFYNDFFASQIEMQYMGWECREKEDLDLVRLDYVYLKNKMLELNSFHIHFNFISANENLDLNDPNSKLLANISDFLKNSKSKENNDQTFSSLYKFKEVLFANNIKRRNTHPVSKYLYTSICNLECKEIEDWQHLFKCIWAPLYLHNEGVSKDVACRKLEEDSWRSTDFFVNFYQPGALVSISTAFPEKIYQDNFEWFSGLQICESDKPNFRLPDCRGWKGEAYDLLPEYPPLKYLGLLPLELSGFVEENLRYLYDIMLDIQQAAFPNRLWRSVFNLSKLELLYYKSNNQECLKLPITREYSAKLRDNKIQENIYDNLKDLKASMLNGIMLLLAIIATILTFLTLIPQSLEIIITIIDYLKSIPDIIKDLKALILSTP